MAFLIRIARVAEFHLTASLTAGKLLFSIVENLE